MGRRQRYADHDAGRIIDPLDATAVIFAAIDDTTGRVVGTVRCNFLKHARVPEYEQLYRLSQHARVDRNQISITTRIIVASTHRRSSVTHRLVVAAYEMGRELGISEDFCDCNDPVRPFFERLGYVWLERIHHEEYGEVNLMRITLGDTEHLTKVGSPFASRGLGRRALAVDATTAGAR
jgi:GNAT superfamily N-acetyltransferase